MISMSPALPASPGHWKPKSLLDQGWPSFDCNICTSQEVHMSSPRPMLVHLSGSRDMLSQGLLDKPGGSRTAGDVKGNDTGSTQARYCQLLPLSCSSQLCGYVKFLASNFTFNPPHPFYLIFLTLSVPEVL